MVAIGDSLTAGMQDANLVGSRQQNSFPALIARQAGWEFRQPLLTEKGIPPRLFLSPGSSLTGTGWRYALVGASLAVPGLLAAFGLNPPEALYHPLYLAGGMGRREHKGEVDNHAIPGFEARHLFTVANVHDYAAEVIQGVEARGAMIAEIPFVRQITQGGRSARNGQAQIDAAIAQKPDLVMLWAGNNDALSGAMSGQVSDFSLTPMEDRRWKIERKDWPWSKPREVETEKVMPGFASTMQGLVNRLLSETDAEVMLMNIPDVTVIPHLYKLGEKVGPLPFRMILPNGTDVTEKIENWCLPTRIHGDGKDGRLYFPAGSTAGLGQIMKKLTHYYKVQTEDDVDMAINAMSRGEGCFSEDEALDPQETERIQGRIREYNQLLKELEDKNPRVHLVDINAMLKRAASEGVPLTGDGPAVTVTNTFTGQKDGRGFEGMFSFDGIHPSDIGYAVVANEIMARARQDLAGDPRFASLVTAAPVDEKAVLANDPHRAGPQQMLLNGYVSNQLQPA